MKRLLLFAVVVGAFSMFSSMAVGQEDDGNGEQMAEMMAKMQQYMNPGENHKLLEQFVGKWDVATKMWMDPAAPPAESPGEATFELMFGGRFLTENLKSDMMGQPFHGFGLYGYDNLRQEFFNMWIDNFGTMMATARGSYDAKTKTLTMNGKMDDVMTGEKDKNFTYVYKLPDPDHMIFEIQEHRPDGTKFKVMEASCTRKK